LQYLNSLGGLMIRSSCITRMAGLSHIDLAKRCKAEKIQGFGASAFA